VASRSPRGIHSGVTRKISARNQLKAIITNESVKSLGLVEGKSAYAVIKASSILVGVD